MSKKSSFHEEMDPHKWNIANNIIMYNVGFKHILHIQWLLYRVLIFIVDKNPQRS